MRVDAIAVLIVLSWCLAGAGAMIVWELNRRRKGEIEYWVAFAVVGAGFLILNSVGYFIDWGTDEVMYRSVGWPSKFWWEHGRNVYFKAIRLVGDVGLALF